MNKQFTQWAQVIIITLFVYSVKNTHAQSSTYSRKDFKKDSVYAVQLLDWIKLYHDEKQNDSCLLLLNKAIPYFSKLGLADFMTQSLSYRGAIYREYGEYQKALSDFGVALNYYTQTGNKKEQASILNQIGGIYRQRGNYATALDYYYKSLKLYRDINHKPGISSVLNNIGVVHLYQKLYEKALNYYQKSLAIEEELKREDGITISYLNIGEVYKKLGDREKASNYYLKALIYAGKTNDLDAIGTIYNELAGINIDKRNTKDVYRYLKLARSTFNRLKSPIRLAECEINFGKYYLQIGKPYQAKKHFKEALDIASNNNLLDLISNAHMYLSRVYENLNNTEKAYIHFKKYIETRDSIFNEENTRKSIETEFFYKFERQQELNRIEQAKKEAEYTERLRRERTIKTYLLLIIFLGTILVGIILLTLKKINHKNIKLKEKQDEILEKNEELLQQQEEILAQRDEIERKSLILEHTQQIVAEKNERMISSIEYAKTIQNALLPKVEQIEKFFNDYFIIYKPKDIVSGDFYWISSDERYTYAAVMDCTGHGVPGAFMSMIGNTLLNKIVNEWEISTPSKVLDLLDEQLREALKQRTGGNNVLAGIDLAFVTIDKLNRQVIFSGASRPLLIIQNNEMQLIKGSIRSTGGIHPAKLRPFEDIRFEIITPTFIYLFSDGYTDQISAERKKFGIKHFTETIFRIYTKPMQTQQEILKQMMENHLHGAEQIDDICVLGLRLD